MSWDVTRRLVRDPIFGILLLVLLTKHGKSITRFAGFNLTVLVRHCTDKAL